MTRPGHIGFALLALCAACAETDPLPSPAAPREDSVFVSSASALTSDASSVAVVGLPGAVEDAGKVRIAHFRAGAKLAELSLAVSEEGSFAQTLQAAADDLLEVFYEAADGRTSVPLRLVVPGPAKAAIERQAESPTAAAPEQFDTAGFPAGNGVPRFTAHAPDAGGAATVEGADLAPGIEAVVAVPTRGSSARSVVDASGKFSLRVRANAGDTLVVFTRDPASGHTSPVVTQVVPAP